MLKNKIIRGAFMSIKNKRRTLYILFIFIFVFSSVFFICPETIESRSQFHSSQLKKQTIQIDNVEKTDYIDEKGHITIAADLGYATKILTRTTNSILEQYFDDKGRPISRYNGYYALLREYDDIGNNIRNTYLNQMGEPMIMANGYAIDEREYNDNKETIAVRYYDNEKHPVMTPLLGYGEIYEYDDNGRIGKITYIDDSNNPMMTGQGYASVTRTYYSSEGPEDGKVKKEMYFDENGQQVRLSLGQFGVYKEYDNYGRNTVLTYLDKKGEPIVTNNGYTTIKRSYHADNSIETERYYDIEGNPFSLSEGQYGIIQDKNETVYLNEKGKVIFNLRNYLYSNSWMAIPVSIFSTILCNLVNKRWRVMFLLAYLCAIIYMTLMFRESNTYNNPELLWSYKRLFTESEARADIYKNIWLFIPLGATLFYLYPKKIILLIPLVLSILIECIQLFSSTGFCELDDIISNTLGAYVGFYLGKLTDELIQRIKSWRHIHTI